MSANHWFHSRMQEMTASECTAMLQSHQVGRIVFTDESGPMALPVNYTMDGDVLLLATSSYGSIARGTNDARVAFEVDDVDDFTESGSSVVVRGFASHVDPLAMHDDQGPRPYPWAEGARHHLVRIRPDSVTGRRLLPV